MFFIVVCISWNNKKNVLTLFMHGANMKNVYMYLEINSFEGF